MDDSEHTQVASLAPGAAGFRQLGSLQRRRVVARRACAQFQRSGSWAKTPQKMWAGTWPSAASLVYLPGGGFIWRTFFANLCKSSRSLDCAEESMTLPTQRLYWEEILDSERQ